MVRDQAYCIILSFAHRTFRSVLVISSSNCFAINMSTTKRSFDTAFKLKVVKAAEDHNKHYAAKLFNVNRRREQEWCAQKEKLQSLTQSGRPSDAKRRRLQGGGRKCINEDIDNTVLHWLQERREAGVRVTGKALKQYALQQHHKNGSHSRLHVDGFINLRKATTSASDDQHTLHKRAEQ